jgi:hypothetical protein
VERCGTKMRWHLRHPSLSKSSWHSTGVNFGKVGQELEGKAVLWDEELVYVFMQWEGSARVFARLVFSQVALTIDWKSAVSARIRSSICCHTMEWFPLNKHRLVLHIVL